MLNISDQILYQGDTWSWEEELSDYPASTHTLRIYLKYQNKTVITLTAAASGDTHVVSFTAAESASIDPGEYKYHARATNNSTSAVNTVETGTIEILKDLSTISDERSWVQQAIDNIEAILPTVKEAAEVTINGRTVKYYSKAELLKEYAHLKFLRKEEIKKERIKQGIDSGGKIKVEFR